MQIKNLDHLVLTVRDIETTRLFYDKLLGMEIAIFGNKRKTLRFGGQKNTSFFGNELALKAKKLLLVL